MHLDGHNIAARRRAPGNGLRTGLVSYWKMDDATNANAADAHGSNEGTQNGGILGAGGAVLNTCRFFTAADSQYFGHGTISALDSAAAASVSVWILRTDAANQNVLLGTGSGGNHRFELFLGLSDMVYPTVAGSSNSYGYSYGFAHSNSTWYHYAMVFDGSQGTNEGRLKLYINGTEQILSYIGTIPSTLSTNANQGAWNTGYNATEGLYSDGYIDEMGLWSRALSAADVTLLYNSGSGRAYSTFS